VQNYLVFLGVVLVATISPGPAVFLALKNGARYDYFSALFGVLGNITALLIFASLSALGLGAILLASPQLFFVTKMIGSCYLCYLGIKLWLSKTVTNSPSNATNDMPSITSKVSNLAIYQEGLLVGITNPKTVIFFAALFPQFIYYEKAFFLQFSLLAITIAFFSFLFLAIYTGLSATVRKFLNRPKAMLAFNKVIATVFIAYGVGLLFFAK